MIKDQKEILLKKIYDNFDSYDPGVLDELLQLLKAYDNILNASYSQIRILKAKDKLILPVIDWKEKAKKSKQIDNVMIEAMEYLRRDTSNFKQMNKGLYKVLNQAIK